MHIQNINHEAIQKLLATDSPKPAVTIYAPMHVTASPPHVNENQIRLKNLIHKASDELRNSSEGHELSKQLLRMLDEVHDDLDFWQHQTPGLLICARSGAIDLFHLPIDTEEYVSIDDSFHLAPVLAMMNEQQEYYVLTVTQKNPVLLKGNMYGLEPTDIKLPASISEGLNLDEPARTQHNKTFARQRGGNETTFQNSRGGAREENGEDRLRFFMMIDNIVCSTVDTSCPLILAGVEAETVEYRHHSRHPHILESTIHGSHADAKPSELLHNAQDIIEKDIMQPARSAAIEEYEQLEGANPDRVAHHEDDIATAADQGRIDKLLATLGRQTADTVRDTAQRVTKISFPEPVISRKVNRLALKVWQMSGKVISIRQDEMPNGNVMVARLRY